MARNVSELDFDYGDEDDGRRPGPQPKDWFLLTLRAARRRKLLFLAVFVAACSAVFAYYHFKTPVYRVEAKILAQRQQLLSTLRSGPEDHPTHTAWELIHRRENLVSLVKSAGLLTPAEPGWLQNLLAKIGGPRDDEVPVDRVVKKLDRALTVTADEGTIDISLNWPDAEQAYRVVDGALQNFIEARHIQEVTAIEEVMAVLRARAAKGKE
ncbi:MAG TPA: lipopolysaccharide biosynthesis protein, partial [Myxococcaceae bacterium]|nr:lipopolysaccharide biosynthesis protein [Myxococcaceae bacterium]